MLTLDHYPIPKSDVLGRIVDGEAVLVLPDKGEVKVLNPVGARIWTLADGTRSVRDIVSVICAEYEVEQAQAESDTLAFLAELEARGIVSVTIQAGRS